MRSEVGWIRDGDIVGRGEEVQGWKSLVGSQIPERCESR